jgi:hypothetical protein
MRRLMASRWARRLLAGVLCNVALCCGAEEGSLANAMHPRTRSRRRVFDRRACLQGARVHDCSPSTQRGRQLQWHLASAGADGQTSLYRASLP